MRTIPARLPRRSSAALAALLVAATTGCALLSTPSPTTTVTDASGREVTLSWADYPGDPYVEPAEVLAAPRAEHAEAVAEAQLTELRAAIDAHAPGLAWERALEGGVYPHDGNGYGGPTAHRTLNATELHAADVPDDWPALVTVIEAELAELGYGPIEWEFEREPFEHETPAERDAAVVEGFGALEPERMWQWLGTAHDGAMWVTVMLVDVDRGVGAPPDAEPGSPERLGLMVGGTVIAAADEQAYRDGVAPFEGLEHPEPTES